MILFDKNLLYWSAFCGSPNCFEYFAKNKYPIDKDVLESAFGGGDINILDSIWNEIVKSQTEDVEEIEKNSISTQCAFGCYALSRKDSRGFKKDQVER